MTPEFKRAERKQIKLKIGITGPSGSGKTASALLMAFGIGNKVALVDTEHDSASTYIDVPKAHPLYDQLKGREWDALNIDPPYTIAKYTAAISAAIKAGYEVLVIDTISHAWAGEGGLLQKKEEMDARGGRGERNQFTNWGPITKEHEQFKATLLNADIHLICTLRSKQDYILVSKDGKQVPQKVGMAPIQREGIEYEFVTVFDMAMDHTAATSKDRTGLWGTDPFVPTIETGKRFIKWLASAKPAPQAPPANAEPQAKPGFTFPEEGKAASGPSPTITPEQTEKIQIGIKALTNLGRSAETIWKGLRQTIVRTYQKEFAELNELTGIEADTVIAYLAEWEKYEKQPKQPRPAAGGSRG